MQAVDRCFSHLPELRDSTRISLASTKRDLENRQSGDINTEMSWSVQSSVGGISHKPTTGFGSSQDPGNRLRQIGSLSPKHENRMSNKL